MGNVVSDNRYFLYQRENGFFYLQEIQSGKQQSLRTKNKDEAERLLFAKNEAARDAIRSREIGMAYLFSADPGSAERAWKWVFEQILSTKKGENLRRWKIAVADKALDGIRTMKLLDTRAEDFLTAMNRGTVSTNAYLRRIHNFALDMGWLPKMFIVKRQWPRVKYGKKRAITWEEHCKIIEREGNPERRDYYELLWYAGGSQGDMAHLTDEDIDWNARALRFFRDKTDTVVYQRFGDKAAEILQRRPQKDYLFPYLATVRASDRATEFKQRCEGLGTEGITLHSYRHFRPLPAPCRSHPHERPQLPTPPRRAL